MSSWHLYTGNRLIHYFPFVAAGTNWISNILVLFTFNMGDQDHDSFFSSIMLKNIDNQIPIEFNQATPSKTATPTTRSTSSIIEKESYKDKKCDQLATNHMKQELLREIKHYILSLQ